MKEGNISSKPRHDTNKLTKNKNGTHLGTHMFQNKFYFDKVNTNEDKNPQIISSFTLPKRVIDEENFKIQENKKLNTTFLKFQTSHNLHSEH